ncbi:hypothetical protein C2E23DRAFT_599055 [Lenzites betulinus]|nr:hypothetical protein C2E23DRAFT_599055 [Lenzites betulinus]
MHLVQRLWALALHSHTLSMFTVPRACVGYRITSSETARCIWARRREPLQHTVSSLRQWFSCRSHIPGAYNLPSSGPRLC